MIAMNNNVNIIDEDKALEIKRNNDIADFLQNEILSEKLLNEVIKNHQSATWVSSSNYEPSSDLVNWMKLVEFTDVLPDYYEKEYDLGVNPIQLNAPKSWRSFSFDWKISKENFGKLLRSAFGRYSGVKSKNYPSAGALYPVLPLIYVFKEDIIESISTKGCYVFDSTQLKMLLIKEYDHDDIIEISKHINAIDKKLWSPLAIGYAIDIKRAITKYKKRGYRNALIEIGAMTQSFRYSLETLNLNLGEVSFSGFNDNALTYYSGLNPRLVPVTLIQWFGEKNDI